MSTAASQQPVALLDTTVQVDRCKTGVRRRRLDELLSGFFTVTTSIALLEFKATIVQECITIHNSLRRSAKFTASRDALIESQHPQSRLRAHIFNNLLNVFPPSSMEIIEDDDRRLAEKARLQLENLIPRLHQWFTEQSVDAFLKEDVDCTRAGEPPTKRHTAFEVNLPTCKRGKNKRCHVEAVIRQRGHQLAAQIRDLTEIPDQLGAACDVFAVVERNKDADLSHRDCRRAGDCLIALEAAGRATHAFSTNAREWEPISQMVGFQFMRVDYPEEKQSR